MNQAQTIRNTIKLFRENVPDYVASGFVDLSTGMLLDVDTAGHHPREILDVEAAAMAHMFEGRNVVQIEGLWKQHRGQTEGGHYFQEILVHSDHLVHLFMRSADDPDIAAAVICTREVSVGMLFAQARQVMREYQAASAALRRPVVASPEPASTVPASPEPSSTGPASPGPASPEPAGPELASAGSASAPSASAPSASAPSASAEPGDLEPAGAEPGDPQSRNLESGAQEGGDHDSRDHDSRDLDDRDLGNHELDGRDHEPGGFDDRAQQAGHPGNLAASRD